MKSLLSAIEPSEAIKKIYGINGMINTSVHLLIYIAMCHASNNHTVSGKQAAVFQHISGKCRDIFTIFEKQIPQTTSKCLFV